MLTQKELALTPSVIESKITGLISTLNSVYSGLGVASTKPYVTLEEDVRGGLTNKIGKLEKVINDYNSLADDLTTYKDGKDDESKALIKTWIDAINKVLENIKSSQSIHEKAFNELKKEIENYESVITTIIGSTIGKTVEAEALVKKYQKIIDRKTVSLEILKDKKSEFDALLQDKNSLLEKAKNLKELQVNYDSAISQITKGTNKEVDAVIDEYNSKKSTMDKDIQVMTDLQGKYIQVIAPYLLLQKKMPDLYSKFNILVNLYESAFNELSALSDSVKKDRSVVAAFRRIEDFNKVKDDPTIENYGTYNRQYNDFIKNVIKGVRVIENRSLSLEDFEKKSLAGKVEYASKMNNILRKTVSDVVSDALKAGTVSKWQADEILKTSQKNVTPVEMATIAKDMQDANLSKSNIVESIAGKKTILDKAQEDKQDNINDYKKYFQDSLSVIKTFPKDDNTEKAIKMIEEAMIAKSIKDKIVVDTYKLVGEIIANDSYKTVVDELKQKYEYYYKDNQDVPRADDLLAIPNGRQQMQNLVNIAITKQDQLRDIGTTAGTAQARTAIENRTKGAVEAMTKAVNLARQRYKQDLINRASDIEVRKLRRESPEVVIKDAIGVAQQERDEEGQLKQKEPVSKAIEPETVKPYEDTEKGVALIKEDYKKLLEGLPQDVIRDIEFVKLNNAMLNAINNKNLNDFYVAYRPAEQIKNNNIIKQQTKEAMINEYSQMIADLNAKKVGLKDMTVIEINNAINQISELFKTGTEENMQKAREIYQIVLDKVQVMPAPTPTNIEQKTEQ